MDKALWIVDCAVRELMLFAGIGFLVGGLDDLLVDLVFLARAGWHRLCGRGDPPTVDTLPRADPPGRLAIFVPAWREQAVIGAMLGVALTRLRHPDYRIYVGCYPNDRATIDAVADVVERDNRVRLVIGDVPGPTTKAGCLNTLWRALGRDDAVEGPTRAVILHDAEDVVHADELTVHDAYLGTNALVQIPVLPFIAYGSPFVSGHYADEFAEAHGRVLPVRAALGAGLPLAGVGCAIRCDALAASAATRGGDPFDAASLTEDYELGLTVGALGYRAALARVRDGDGALIATRALFPGTIDAAVRQKARWMTGIALAGWDRIGWGRALQLSEHWMRMRDRRAPIAVIVLTAAYFSLLGWAGSWALHMLSGRPVAPLDNGTALLLRLNAGLLGWRMLVRAGFTGQGYGWRQAILSVPRALVANLVSLLAARRAVFAYVKLLRGDPLRWDKTEHEFPVGELPPGLGSRQA